VAQLTVMTWNVQNLFPPTEPDATGPYQAKLAQLAAVIDRVAPDVLALQEVGPVSVLDDLDDRCAIDFDHRVAGLADGRGIRVALLSPRRLSNVTTTRAFPDQVAPVQVRDLTFDDPTTEPNEALTGNTSRGILSATMVSGDRRVTVITCHLKSKLISYPPTFPGGDTRFSPRDEDQRFRYAGFAVHRRTAEAMTCRAELNRTLADETQPGRPGAGTQRPVILLGDLNDEPRSATTQILLGPGGSEIDFRPGSGFQRPDAGDEWRMWNLHRLLPADGPSGTRIYRGRPELIDHILASHTLVHPGNLPTVEIVPATALPSMTDDPTLDHPAPTDHAAVIATFTT